MDGADLEHYGQEYLLQPEGERDMSMVERYQQFARHFPEAARRVLVLDLLPGDVDETLCGFQRLLRLRGRLLLTAPNPRYVRLWLTKGRVNGPGHLTLHYVRVLRTRLLSRRSPGFV